MVHSVWGALQTASCTKGLTVNVHRAYIFRVTLSDYMRNRSISDDAFAAVLGVSRATVSRLRRGKMVPSFDLAARIHSATDSQVSPNDFLNAPSRSKRSYKVA